MMNLSTWIVLFCTVATYSPYTVSAETFDELCCLCDECEFPASGRDNLNVDQFGTTCYDQLLSMADTENASTNGSGECTKQIALHRRRCCDSSFKPIEIAIAPTPAPVINLPYGSEPFCNLCADGRFPGIPKTVTAVLYIPGNPTCEILYYMGRRGLIEDRLCNPAQDYLETACGCADPPTPQAPPGPAPAPTPSPTPSANDVVVLYERKDPPPNSARKNDLYKIGAGRIRGKSGDSRRRLLKGA
jgi:hypothetical protein